MDKDLLERYASGNCTAEEKLLVEQWLNSSGDEPTALSDGDLAEMDTHIWASLSQHVGNKQIPSKGLFFNPVFRFVAAASVFVMLAAMSGYFFIGNQPAVIDFTSGIHPDQFRSTTASMDFYLEPHSSVQGELKRRRGNLDFSGSLKMVNSSAADLLINFRAHDTEVSSGKRVRIQSQQTYYVGVLSQQYAPDEILVVNAQQLQDLPPRIRIMAFKDYSI